MLYRLIIAILSIPSWRLTFHVPLKMELVENADSGNVRRGKPLLSLVKTEVGWKVLHWLTVIVELSADACNDPRELLSRARAYIRGTRR